MGWFSGDASRERERERGRSGFCLAKLPLRIAIARRGACRPVARGSGSVLSAKRKPRLFVHEGILDWAQMQFAWSIDLV